MHAGALAVGSEAFGGRVDRVGVAVDADYRQVRMSVEDRRCVTGSAERRVDDAPVGHGSEEINDLGDHDRLVLERAAHLQSPGRGVEAARLLPLRSSGRGFSARLICSPPAGGKVPGCVS